MLIVCILCALHSIFRLEFSISERLSSKPFRMLCPVEPGAWSQYTFSQEIFMKICILLVISNRRSVKFTGTIWKMKHLAGNVKMSHDLLGMTIEMEVEAKLELASAQHTICISTWQRTKKRCNDAMSQRREIKTFVRNLLYLKRTAAFNHQPYAIFRIFRPIWVYPPILFGSYRILANVMSGGKKTEPKIIDATHLNVM